MYDRTCVRNALAANVYELRFHPDRPPKVPGSGKDGGPGGGRGTHKNLEPGFFWRQLIVDLLDSGGRGDTEMTPG